MNHKPDCVIGGTVKKNSLGDDVIGFSIGFRDKKQAQRYKHMFKFIVEDDNLDVELRNGYHDKDEEN